MGKGSIARITVALMIISLYVFLFGIMGTIESIELSLPEQETQEQPDNNERHAPAVTSGVDESGKAVYTYATEINVINARKPSLVDYTGTQTMLVVPAETEDTTTVTTTAVSADFIMDRSDFDYTIPPATTAQPTETPPETTAAPVTTTAPEPGTTAAALVVTTTTTTTAAATTAPETTTTTTATTTVPITEQAEDDDIYDIEEEAETTLPPEDLSEFEIETEDEEEDSDDPDADEIVSEEEQTEPVTETEPEETEEETVAEKTADDEPDSYNAAEDEIFTVNAAGTIISDSALNIVSMAVMAEISDVFNEEAIKAQAIAAYTYIKYYNDNNQNAYIARATPSEKVIRCVKEVLGKAMYYDGKLIQSVYTASTAGRTASSKTVWGTDYPYLISKDTSFIDEPYDINYGRKVTFTSDEMKEYVRSSTGIILSGDPSKWFEIESYVDEIFVGQMKVGGYTTFNNGTRDVTITGRVFRETIMDYDIRSSCFGIEYDPDSDTFTFTTFGYGHCVGMSQHGANILATYHGYSYIDILKFYYTGVEIK